MAQRPRPRFGADSETGGDITTDADRKAVSLHRGRGLSKTLAAARKRSMNSSAGKPETSHLLRFFGKPIVGIFGSIASIVGFLLSVYFFHLSHETPQLTYLSHPVRAAIFRIGEISRLSMQFDGEPVKSDISAVHIAFWNAGRKPIRPADVLSPFVIRTKSGTRILEARLEKSARNVVNIRLDTDKLSEGVLEVEWDVLEKGDGGVIQLIYFGDETVKIEGEAVLVGQRTIRQLYSPEIERSNARYAKSRAWGTILYLI